MTLSHLFSPNTPMPTPGPPPRRPRPPSTASTSGSTTAWGGLLAPMHAVAAPSDGGSSVQAVPPAPPRAFAEEDASFDDPLFDEWTDAAAKAVIGKEPEGFVELEEGSEMTEEER